MASMNVRMRGEEAVPIIIAHRTVTQEPKVNRRWKYVGIKAGLKALAGKVVELVHESFWEPETEVLEAGQSSVVNYALQIVDTPGADQPELVVTRLEGQAKPGCGFYCEVINVAHPEPSMQAPTHPESKAKAVGTRPKRGGSSQNVIKDMIGPDEPPDEPPTPVVS